MTDDSNDVIFVGEPGPKSFKNLFSHEPTKSELKKSTTPPPLTDLNEAKDRDRKDLDKSKADGNGATKRTDWDMFAEQDIDSNFDVSFMQLLIWAIQHQIREDSQCVLEKCVDNGVLFR